jgi:hypothetical protein
MWTSVGTPEWEPLWVTASGGTPSRESPLGDPLMGTQSEEPFQLDPLRGKDSGTTHGFLLKEHPHGEPFKGSVVLHLIETPS